VQAWDQEPDLYRVYNERMPVPWRSGARDVITRTYLTFNEFGEHFLGVLPATFRSGYFVRRAYNRGTPCRTDGLRLGLHHKHTRKISTATLVSRSSVCDNRGLHSAAHLVFGEWQRQRVAGQVCCGVEKEPGRRKAHSRHSQPGGHREEGQRYCAPDSMASITEVGYDTSSHNRGWTWLNAGADVTTQGKGDFGEANFSGRWLRLSRPRLCWPGIAG